MRPATHEALAPFLPLRLPLRGESGAAGPGVRWAATVGVMTVVTPKNYHRSGQKALRVSGLALAAGRVGDPEPYREDEAQS